MCIYFSNRTKRLDHSYHKRERTERAQSQDNYAAGQTSSTLTESHENIMKAPESGCSGYNSGDEHHLPKEDVITVDEWHQRDEKFAKVMADRGFVLRPIEEDGACLFRAISLQIYGDEDMHDVIRQQTMDYIV